MDAKQFVKQNLGRQFKELSDKITLPVGDIVDLVAAYSSLGEIPFVIDQIVYDKEDGECFILNSANDINLITKIPDRFRNATLEEGVAFKKANK